MANDDEKPARWLIISMAPSRTLLVAKALADHGIEAWTPTRNIVRRRPRSKKTTDLTIALMASFVFVRDAHLAELRTALAMPINPFPPFSIFQMGNRIPLIADHEINGLRAEHAAAEKEWQAVLRQREANKARDARDARRRKLHHGVTVRVTQGPAMGMTGVVVGGTRKEARVEIDGRVLKIDSFLLAEDRVAVPLAA